MLGIKHLSYKYDNDYVLKDINIDIKSNEKIAVLGNNGAGKTTLFMCITGILSGYEGKILGDENIGLVFQEPDIQIIGSTVEKEISFGPMNISKDRQWVKKQVDNAITEMDLEHLRYRPTHYMSGGEKKRVCIADILAMNDNILIFDEPTAYLDPINSEILENKLHKLNDDGSTIILSTHDIDFAYRFADRFIILSNGCVIADGDIEVFCDDKMLDKANLKKPILFSIMEIMGERNIKKYPRDIQQFKEFIK